MSVSSLLSSFFTNPNSLSDINSSLTQTLLTEDGYTEFLQLLQKDEKIAFIYLSQMKLRDEPNESVQKQPLTTTLFDVYSRDPFINSLLLLNPHQSNTFYVKQFLNNIYRIQLNSHLIQKLLDHSRFDLIEACLAVYRETEKSNRLFEEILRVIEIVKPTIEEFLSKGFNNQKSRCVLGIIYSLMFQDIHPFFEDNLQSLFLRFRENYKENRELVNEIYLLFVNSYGEFSDYESIIVTITDCNDGLNSIRLNSVQLEINILTRSASFVSPTFLNLVVNFVSKLNCIGDVTIENDCRSVLDDLIGNVLRKYSSFNHPPPIFTDQLYFYQFTSQRIRDIRIMNEAKKIINDYISDHSNIISIRHTNLDDLTLTSDLVIYDAFNYLISIKEFDVFNWDFLDTKFCKKFCQMINFYYKKINKKHVNKMGIHLITHNENLTEVRGLNSGPVDISPDLLLRMCNIALKNQDRYTSEAFKRMLIQEFDKKTDFAASESGIYSNLYSLLHPLMLNIDSISDINSVINLFDCYLFLSIKLHQFNLSFIQYIMENEIVEVYNLLFLYISVYVKEEYIINNAIKTNNFTVLTNLILNILQQSAFWADKSLSLSIELLVLSAYNVEIITKEQVCMINENMKAMGLVGIFLNTKIMGGRGNICVNTFTITEYEWNYLVNNVFSNFLIENFLTRQYARYIIKEMFRRNSIKQYVDDAHTAQSLINQIAIKNAKSIEYEFTLSSIIEYFDI